MRAIVFGLAVLLAAVGCISTAPVATPFVIPTLAVPTLAVPTLAPPTKVAQPSSGASSASLTPPTATAGAGPTVAPVATPTPASGSVPGTRENPVALGSEFTVGEWRVLVSSVDPDAWPKIEAENQFNDPPAAGRQYVMFGATATYNGAGSGNPSFDMSWTIVGSAGNTFGTGTDDYCGVIPNPFSDQGETFPSGTVTGNVCISVASDQIDGATISVEQFLGEERVFVATQ